MPNKPTITRINDNGTEYNISLNSEVKAEILVAIGNATKDTAGFLSAEDKQHLEALYDSLIGNVDPDSSVIDTLKEVLDLLRNFPESQDLKALLDEITNTINNLDVAQIGGNGKYIKFVSQENGKLAATAESFNTSVTNASTDNNAPTSKAVYTAITDAVNALDASEVGSDGNYIKKVSETDGKVSVTKQAFDTSISNSSTDNNAPTSKAVKAYVDTSISNLDIADISNTAGKTISKITEADGKVGAEFQDINISISQVSNLPDELTNISSDISTHKSNTANPHSVTKAQVGLSNVDNKSEATIKSDFTGAIADGNSGFVLGTDVYAHTSSQNNPHGVTKAQIGLGNVDNTSDANKPISTATQTALDTKLNKYTEHASATPLYPYRVYAVDWANGEQVMLQADNAGYKNSVVISTNNGNIFTATPTANLHATTKKYVDDGLATKQNTLDTQTSYSAKGSSYKVPQITTNTLGQVTLIEEKAISTASIDDTIGSETISVNTSASSATALNVVTRDTPQTISGQKTFSGDAADITINGDYLEISCDDAYNLVLAVDENNNGHTSGIIAFESDLDSQYQNITTLEPEFTPGEYHLVLPAQTGTLATTDDLGSFVEGPATSVTGNIATYSNATGKTIKDSGINISSDSSYTTLKVENKTIRLTAGAGYDAGHLNMYMGTSGLNVYPTAQGTYPKNLGTQNDSWTNVYTTNICSGTDVINVANISTKTKNVISAGSTFSNGTVSIMRSMFTEDNTISGTVVPALYMFTYGNAQAFVYIDANMLANSSTSPIRTAMPVIYGSNGETAPGNIKIVDDGTNIVITVANESRHVRDGFALTVIRSNLI